jgi:hypothetical protein
VFKSSPRRVWYIAALGLLLVAIAERIPGDFWIVNITDGQLVLWTIWALLGALAMWMPTKFWEIHKRDELLYQLPPPDRQKISHPRLPSHAFEVAAAAFLCACLAQLCLDAAGIAALLWLTAGWFVIEFMVVLTAAAMSYRRHQMMDKERLNHALEESTQQRILTNPPPRAESAPGSQTAKQRRGDF